MFYRSGTKHKHFVFEMLESDYRKAREMSMDEIHDAICSGDRYERKPAYLKEREKRDESALFKLIDSHDNKMRDAFLTGGPARLLNTKTGEYCALQELTVKNRVDDGWDGPIKLGYDDYYFKRQKVFDVLIDYMQ